MNTLDSREQRQNKKSADKTAEYFKTFYNKPSNLKTSQQSSEKQ
jgi:hypothetical protein